MLSGRWESTPTRASRTTYGLADKTGKMPGFLVSPQVPVLQCYSPAPPWLKELAATATSELYEQEHALALEGVAHCLCALAPTTMILQQNVISNLSYNEFFKLWNLYTARWSKRQLLAFDGTRKGQMPIGLKNATPCTRR